MRFNNNQILKKDYTKYNICLQNNNIINQQNFNNHDNSFNDNEKKTKILGINDLNVKDFSHRSFDNFTEDLIKFNNNDLENNHSITLKDFILDNVNSKKI